MLSGIKKLKSIIRNPKTEAISQEIIIVSAVIGILPALGIQNADVNPEIINFISYIKLSIKDLHLLLDLSIISGIAGIIGFTLAQSKNTPFDPIDPNNEFNN